MKSINVCLIVIFTTITFNNLNAQVLNANRFGLNINAETGIVTGAESDFHSIALGGTIQFFYATSDRTAITLTAGYYNLLSKIAETSHFRDMSPTGNYGIVPIKLGVKKGLNDHFYIALEGGAAIEVSSLADLDFHEEYKQLKMIISPGIGYYSKGWEVGFRYEYFFLDYNLHGDYGNFNTPYGIAGLHVSYKIF